MLGYLWWLLKDFHLNVDGVKFSSFSFTIVTLYLVLISCLEDISSSQGDISILDFSIICFLCLPLCVCGAEDWPQGFTHARQILYQLSYNPARV